MEKINKNPRWSSRYMFLLATVGAAVGLGNIWKFPYIVGENGGGAFVLIYLLCIILVGIPVLTAEILIGKTAQTNPVSAFSSLAKQLKASRFWIIFAYIGVLSGILILSFYSVVAGWSIEYLSVFLQNSLAGSNAAEIANYFTNLLANPWKLLLWHSVFMLMSIVVVAKGVNAGIEKLISWSMPTLFVILIILVIDASQLSGFDKAVSYLFTPDFSVITVQSVLIALGHAFFTLSLGMGAMMIYGSYLDKNTPIIKLSLGIAALDTLVALLSGLAIFPLIFTYGLEPSSGPSLLFISLPNALLAMPFGQFVGIAFFFLLLIAALSSAISILEVVVSYIEQTTRFRRMPITWLMGALIWFIGISVLLSFNEWSKFELLLGKDIFNSLDDLTTNVLLPLGGLGIALFAGWILAARSDVKASIGLSGLTYKIWLFASAIIAPIAIIIIALNSFGFINL